MNVAQQVLTNLVHYNLWTEVLIHKPTDESSSANSFAILSGLPPAKLDQLDPTNQREWVIGRLMQERKCGMDEVDKYFQTVAKLNCRPKRISLALVSDDGTVTYYFVHDGAIKPRQN